MRADRRQSDGQRRLPHCQILRWIECLRERRLFVKRADQAMKLVSAAYDQDEAQVRALLESGVNPNWPTDGLGGRPLCHIVLLGSPEVVQLLLQYGAEVNYHSDPHQFPPLVGACTRISVEPEVALCIARALFDAGADPWTTWGDKREFTLEQAGGHYPEFMRLVEEARARHGSPAAHTPAKSTSAEPMSNVPHP